MYFLVPFVCGSCSVKEDILCSNQKIKIFYQDKEKMSREELDDYKYQGLVSRALQSIDEQEYLQFPGSSKLDFILFLRFRFGLTETDAGTVFDRLQFDRAVDVIKLYIDVNNQETKSKFDDLEPIIKLEPLDVFTAGDLKTIASDLITDPSIPAAQEDFKPALGDSEFSAQGTVTNRITLSLNITLFV